MTWHQRKSPPVLPPVAVGGIGGSGTRLIAQILRHLGYYMGDDLNEAGDNLWFTLLFKRPELWLSDQDGKDFEQVAKVFRAVMVDGTPLTEEQEAWVKCLAAVNRPQHDSQWLRQRAESLLEAARRQQGRAGNWGWKEPNTHVFLDRFQAAFPEMKYIQVMRNGLDMAHSSNQNQLKLWGPFFFGTNEFEPTARLSLKYWCLVHRRIVSLQRLMPGRLLLLNYDKLCSVSQESLQSLLGFLDVKVDTSTVGFLLNLITPPDSIGRYKEFGLQVFDDGDVAYVKSFGFETSCS